MTPPTPSWRVRRAEPGDWSEWLALRQVLWPETTAAEHEREMQLYLSTPELAVFVAEENERLLGFLEASLRPYAEGCATSPVGYIEGWFVRPEKQRQGIGRALVQAAEAWATQKGCKEMASDCLLTNLDSFRAHLALGYEEVERVICFRKTLTRFE